MNTPSTLGFVSRRRFLISLCSTVDYSKANVSHRHVVHTHIMEEGWRAVVLLVISSWYTNTKDHCVWRRLPALSSFIPKASPPPFQKETPPSSHPTSFTVVSSASFLHHLAVLAEKTRSSIAVTEHVLNAKCQTHTMFEEFPWSRKPHRISSFHMVTASMQWIPRVFPNSYNKAHSHQSCSGFHCVKLIQTEGL